MYVTAGLCILGQNQSQSDTQTFMTTGSAMTNEPDGYVLLGKEQTGLRVIHAQWQQWVGKKPFV